MMIDYRSDTVTKPSLAMREIMATAPVGDDVFGEDPSVNALESRSAALFGFEAGLFCPSGTMTNQIAIKVHTRPGDEVICEKNSHIYYYEGGGIAFNSGASVRLIEGNRGRITADQVLVNINPDDVHRPVSRLVSLENTCNRGGGSCYNLEEVALIRKVCQDNGMLLHLDGARLFNAIVAKKEDPKRYSQLFDSVSVCLSKGLGAPVGSVLLGSKNMIKMARRVRKVFGGGMRQAGILATAALYALENNVERMVEDHAHATLLGDALAHQAYIDEVLGVETNIVIATFKAGYDPAKFLHQMKEKGILLYQISPNQIRLVTHLDINPEMIEKTIEAIKSI
ncbi:MAG: threonine aldolase family protein [Chitinophagaceae bacterium]